MFHRLTQTERYWTQDFSIASDDLDHVDNRLLEEEKPLPVEELARAVICHRVEQEESELERLLSRGTVYRPRESYQIGETLVFPALSFHTGTVTNIRRGHSPEAGEFEVIEVKLEHTKRKREFAAALQPSHPLDKDTDALLGGDTSLTSDQELWQEYGNWVGEALLAALEEQDDVVHLFGFWFLKALLTEIGPGYLNIAEAILDIAGGGPLPTSDLLKDLDLPEDSRPELLDFSLSYALDHDDRFDEVGPAGVVLWYLRRLEPADVLFPPKRLAYTPTPYDRNLLNLNLRRLEEELDDEWSSGWQPDGTPGRVSFTLTLPHRRQGTIPLSSNVAPLFPTSYQAPRIRCTFVDPSTDRQMDAWVVWEGRYVHGLANWYEENDLPTGAYLHLTPGPNPGIVTIEYETRRPQSEWVRVAFMKDGQLMFGMQKRAMGCVYDDMMMIGMDNPSDADAAWITTQEKGLSLAQIIVELFPALARLSPQTTVHARTLYSAVNIVCRCPPGPIFSELVRQPCFISMGDNYWQFDSSLWSGG
ncbi:MAG: hypothetical protein KAS81_05600 [Anaerolineales bacterium]|nr:hypothetical protein [Anaerolineales bacterium]